MLAPPTSAGSKTTPPKGTPPTTPATASDTHITEPSQGSLPGPTGPAPVQHYTTSHLPQHHQKHEVHHTPPRAHPQIPATHPRPHHNANTSPGRRSTATHAPNKKYTPNQSHPTHNPQHPKDPTQPQPATPPRDHTRTPHPAPHNNQAPPQTTPPDTHTHAYRRSPPTPLIPSHPTHPDPPRYPKTPFTDAHSAPRVHLPAPHRRHPPHATTRSP